VRAAHEANYGMEGILRGARFRDKQAAKRSRPHRRLSDQPTIPLEPPRPSPRRRGGRIECTYFAGFFASTSIFSCARAPARTPCIP